METGTFLKVANKAIQLYWVSDRWADLCWWMVTFATFQNVPVSIQMVRTVIYQPNLTSLVSK